MRAHWKRSLQALAEEKPISMACASMSILCHSSHSEATVQLSARAHEREDSMPILPHQCIA